MGKIATTLAPRPTGIAALLAGAKAALAAARRRRAERAELAHLTPGDRDRILRDLGEPPGDLSFIDRAQPCTQELLAGMMARLGVDRDHGVDPAEVMRDLERTCAECPEWRRCRYWLAGEINGDPREFCLNIPTFDALQRQIAPSVSETRETTHRQSLQVARRR